MGTAFWVGVETRGEMFALVSRTLGGLEQLVNSKIHLLNPVRDPLSIPITCQEGISKKASYWQAKYGGGAGYSEKALTRSQKDGGIMILGGGGGAGGGDPWGEENYAF